MSTDTRNRSGVFVDGRWRPALDGEDVVVVNPSDKSEVGRAVLGGARDIDAAVAAARRAFDDGRWRDLAAPERARILHRAADLLEARIEEGATLVTQEVGVLHTHALAAAITNPVMHLRYYADLVREESERPEELRADGGARSLVVSDPIGVVAAVTPWNGPVASATLKVAPALAVGCSVVLKPPPETPLAVSLLADALAEAGVPDGVFNLVCGGREAGRALVADPRVDKVAFTGSTVAGRAIMATCADRIARVTLELGGKSAAVVLEDADLDETIAGLLPMTTLVNGQACFLQSRLLVPRSREAEFAEAFGAVYSGLRTGDPFSADTQLGPMINETQRTRIEGYLAGARDEGATVIGGGRPDGQEQGFFLQGALVTGVTNDMTVAREEVFGPVVAMIAYDTPEEAVRVANDSIYGLAASVWSADVERAVEVGRRLAAGRVHVNGAPHPFGAPFGGFKQSGIGREMCPETLAAYRELKSISLPS